jgi:uncharacterized damage-inducible protein DinB
MSQLKQFALLAEYNRLMNQRQMEAAARLPAEILRRDAGAFFDSILGTLNHIMVGDIVWMKRFANHPSHYPSLDYLREREHPTTLDQILHTDLDALEAERAKLDGILIDWCSELKQEDLDTALNYKNMMGKAFSKNLGDLILHLFLHQTHHRGQVTTLLCQQGVDFGDTDLIEIIPNLST